MDNRQRLIYEAKNLARQLSKIYGIEMLSKSRKRDVVLARQAYVTLLVEDLGMTLGDAAAVFGQDHSSAVHSRKQMKNALILKDEISEKMCSYYATFKPLILKMKESFEASKKEAEEMLTDVMSLHGRIDEMNRRLDEAIKIIVKTADEKVKAQKASREFEQQTKELHKKYMELKSQYDIMNPSKDEEREVQRMQGYIA